MKLLRPVILLIVGCGACQKLPTEPTPIDLSQELPIAVPDTTVTDEDVALLIDVLDNDSSLVDDELKLAEIEVEPTEGSASIESGEVRYEPAPNFSGLDSLRYVVSGSVLSNSAPVYITVTPVNDPPVANDDEFVVAGNAPAPKVQAELDVLANDTDIDGDRLSVLRTTEPANGQTEIPPGGESILYTPAEGFTGSDLFQYTIQDGNGGVDAAVVRITVEATNDPPVAVNDSYGVREDEVLTAEAPGVLGNDEDEDGDPLEAVLKQDPSHGVLALMADGSFRYEPEADFAGSDAFLYAATDGMSESNVAIVSLTVLAVNDRPVGLADTFRVNEDAELNVTAPGVLVNDLEPEGAPLSARLVSDVSNGNLTFEADGAFTYTPVRDFNGTDSFAYRASDGDSESDEVSVTIFVMPVNDPPNAVVDSYQLNEDEALVVAAPGVIANDSDVDGDVLTASLETTPTSGSVDLASDGSFTYTPEPDFSGLDGFTYRVSDGALSNVAAVSLRVNPQNDAPVAEPDAYETPANVDLSVEAPGLLANDMDPENDRLTAEIVALPTHGQAIVNADGSFQYMPNTAFFGEDVFTYRAADATLTSEPVNVTIAVTSEGSPPLAADDFYSASTDSALLVEAPGVLENDTDPDQDILTVILVEDVDTGTLTLEEDGSFVFEADPEFAGIATFSYRATDGSNVSNVALVQLTVQ